MSAEHKLTAALAGNPNCGKTTLFNALTGANQHVGNYSGVTVEKKSGTFKHQGHEVTMIDLPGTYSLNYHSPEERIAQEELLSGKIDLLVAVVDSGCLSRSLLFAAQLMQLNLPMILCLNMWDDAEKSGLSLDVEQMSALLGMPVIQTVASHGKGIDTLRDTIIHHENYKVPTEHLRLGSHAANAIRSIKSMLPEAFSQHGDWTAVKLLAGDAKYTEEISKFEDGRAIIKTADDERRHIESDTGMDIKLFITEQYSGFIDGLLKEVTRENKRLNARETSDRIDRVLAHPLFGLPIFLFIIYLLFQCTFTIGQYPMDWLEAGFDALRQFIGTYMEDGWLKSMIVDGIIGGVGGVVVFLPNIIILFLGLCFLEDTGYLARSAFILDRLMHKVGLHGRSFIPLVTGFGCSIPGLMATRTIAGEKERLTTMFVLPFMSCGARVPIWLLLVPCFFAEKYQGLAMLSIYLLGIVTALFIAYILRKTVFKGHDEPFVMELPPYRMPTLRAIMLHMWERSWLYLKKAGTIILGISIVLWALSTFPEMNEAETAAASAEIETQIKQDMPELIAENSSNSEQDADDEESLYEVELNARLAERAVEHSAIGMIGRAIEPVFKPLGFDWRISTAAISAIAAKEVFVSQMGIVYAVGEADAEDPESASTIRLRERIKADYGTLTGICIIIFMLLTSPCAATLAVMKRESNSWKYALIQWVGMFVIAWGIAFAVQQIGSLLI